jgi:predicted aldo/keto reductase-like oxidoreductase
MVHNNKPDATVPRRLFGNTGVTISKLCLGGGSFGSTDRHALLGEALKLGVDCWEIVSFTGNVYGDYFKKNPGIRENVFLSGKVYSTDPTVMQAQLNQILKENETSFIDFLAVHPVDEIKVLDKDVRKWVEHVKKKKKIRFFGFCTHKKMEACLGAAAKLGWIDGVQTFYNHRMRRVKSMEDALQKCHDAGMGIFAVKSMGFCVQKTSELLKHPLREKLNAWLAGRDVSFEQVKLKAIWQNPVLTSVCSLMPDPAVLQANVAASMDEQPLNSEISNLLVAYANSTGHYFCRRCGACETENADQVPISAIMELLMYSRRYGKRAWAAGRLAQIPRDIRNKMAHCNFANAEKRCPQKMPITQLIKEADLELQTGTASDPSSILAGDCRN